MGTVGTVGEIWCYPVKSMGGQSVPSTELGRLGIADDRRWALRNLDTGKIISAKMPKLGRVLLSLQASFDGATGAIRVADDGGADLGEVGSAALDATLSDRLGTPVRAEQASTTADEVYDSWWPEVEGLVLSDVAVELPLSMETEKGTFVDLAALHLVATGSMRHLAELMPESTIVTRRFRPSIVIETTEHDGFVEEAWCQRTATLGGARLSISTQAPRCVMTTLPQPGVPADKGVLQTLAAENRVTVEGLGDFACLGVYAEVLEPGPVAVGDDLVLDPPA